MRIAVCYISFLLCRSEQIMFTELLSDRLYC